MAVLRDPDDGLTGYSEFGSEGITRGLTNRPRAGPGGASHWQGSGRRREALRRHATGRTATYRVRNWELFGAKPLRSMDDVADCAREAVAKGYTALKTNIIWPGDPPRCVELLEHSSPSSGGRRPMSSIATDGPLAQSGPGDITKWMAVPWQTDTASCRAGHDAKMDPYIRTFWPSRVPNHVPIEADYRIVVDPHRPVEDRIAAFNRCLNWLRSLDLRAPYVSQITKMVATFGSLGIRRATRRRAGRRALPARHVRGGGPLQRSWHPTRCSTRRSRRSRR